jgi:hypothetical protein
MDMLSADYRAAKALMEMRLAEGSGQVYEPEPKELSQRVPEAGLAHRLVRKLALVLVSSGGRLVYAGLPPRHPSSLGTSG